MNSKLKDIPLIILLILSVFLVSTPYAEAKLYVDWSLNTTDKGEFITAFAHLYGVPEMEKEDLYFCRVELDATTAEVPTSGIIEVRVGDYAQPDREVYQITEKKVYTYGLNPTFNNKVAEVLSPTPIMVDLKLTDKSGNQLYAESKTVQMLPLSYYAWVRGEKDLRDLSPVLATPHAEPIQKILSTAARATPWNSIVGYQEISGYSHYEVVEGQMRAVYNVLQNLGITYVATMTAFSATASQRVRLPVQTVSDNCGNCIETTLLFDSIFEAIGFKTSFVFITGHVFLAVWEWPDSDSVLPLETTLLGTKTYDEARNVGLSEYKNAKNDPAYLEVNIQKMRAQGLSPTPYMDKMPEVDKFYEKVSQITLEITSVSETIKEINVTKVKSMPPKVEELYQKAKNLFNIGKYQEAKNCTTEVMDLIGQSGNRTTTTVTTSKTPAVADKTSSTVLGFIFLLMPVALVIMGALYIKAKRRARVTKPVAPAVIPSPPPSRYCVACRTEITPGADFCKYCGVKRTI